MKLAITWIDVREDIDDSFTAPVAIAFLNSTASSFVAGLVCESLDIQSNIKSWADVVDFLELWSHVIQRGNTPIFDGRNKV